MQLRLTAAQLARLADIPVGSIGYHVASGLLRPSVRRAGAPGQPHIFNFGDLVVARTLTQLRLSTTSVRGLRGIFTFWRSKRGRQLLDAISAEVTKVDGVWARTTYEKVFVVLRDGSFKEETNRPIVEMTRQYESAVVHVIDVGLVVQQAVIDVTEGKMLGRLVQPGPGGRVPRDDTQKKESGRRAANAHDASENKKRRRK